MVNNLKKEYLIKKTIQQISLLDLQIPLVECISRINKKNMNMKAIIYPVLFILTFSAFGQITHQPKTLTILSKPAGGDNKLDISFTNSTNTAYQVYWQVIKDTNWKPGWETYICDLEFCYGSNVDKSNPSLPNKFVTGTHKIEFHFDPKGVKGNANVVFKLFSDKNFTQELYSVNVSLQSTFLSHTPNPLAINTVPSSGDNKLNITFNNSADTTYTVFWKLFKDQATWKAGFETYICDLEFCYGNNVDQSNPSIPNKFTKGNHLIEFHFFPNNISGCSKVGLKLYGDKAFTQEIYSTSIDINNCLSDAEDIILQVNNRIYPNPASNSIRLAIDNNVKIVEIYNLIGQKIESIDYSDKSDINVSAFGTGMYIVKLLSEDRKNIGVTKFYKL